MLEGNNLSEYNMKLSRSTFNSKGDMTEKIRHKCSVRKGIILLLLTHIFDWIYLLYYHR